MAFTPASPTRSSQVKPQRHPSQELVLARRDALSRRGKTPTPVATATALMLPVRPRPLLTAAPAETTKSCGCGGKRAAEKALSTGPKFSARSERRSATQKRRAIENPSRALVLARREAMAKHGKTAGKQPTSAAAVAARPTPISPAGSWPSRCKAPSKSRCT